jgi:Galactose oxidase, central domain
MMEMAVSVMAAAKSLFKHTHPLAAKWVHIRAPPLSRSSHTISVVKGRAYIFGGEIQSRLPVDNDMHVIILPAGTVAEADYFKVPAKALPLKTGSGGESTEENVPAKRVGHTAAIIGDQIFVFGGRGGKDMEALEEHGRVWVFDTKTYTWDFLDPLPGTPYPSARSYHASVAIDRPQPQTSLTSLGKTGDMAPADLRAGIITTNAQAQGEGYGTLFVHAGCLSSGRANDLWGFDIRSRTWKEFPVAPGNPRGGTTLTIAKNRIYRYGGFNGETEEGGQVDFLELAVDTFEEVSAEGPGEVALAPKTVRWESLIYEADVNIAKPGEEGGNREAPGWRSVAGLHTITTGMGREYLVLLLGERGPSSIGHEGAGKFWGDVWAFQVSPLGMTGASLKDATWQALGQETGEGLWSQIHVADAEMEDGMDNKVLNPGGRGWFASASMGELDQNAVILWGGLNEKNEREGDGWILSIE